MDQTDGKMRLKRGDVGGTGISIQKVCKGNCDGQDVCLVRISDGTMSLGCSQKRVSDKGAAGYLVHLERAG